MVTRRRAEFDVTVPANYPPLHLLGVAEQPWMRDALCAEVDTEMFFPEKGGSTKEAKDICARCPVAAECLNYALANGERFGIWGGTSERERRRLERGLPLEPKAKTCPVCGTTFTVHRDNQIYCTARCQDRAKQLRAREHDDENPTEEVA